MEGQKPRKKKVILIPLYSLLLFGCLLFIGRELSLRQAEAEGIQSPVPSESPLITVRVMAAPAPTPEILEETPDDLDVDYDDEIDEALVSEDPIEKTEAISDRVVNILLIGEDTRPYEKSQGRSDTQILLSFNRDTGSVQLVSFLRDIYIYIPGRSSWNRINTAFRYGGVGLCINTINENFDLDIAYYMEVDFDGVMAIVDILGGLELELSSAEADYINMYTGRNELHGGTELLDGEQVLAHCRNRSTGDGDWGRTARQRTVLFAIFSKAKDQGAGSILSLATKLIKYVDTNLRLMDIVSLGMEAVTNDSLRITSTHLPFEDTWRYARVDGKSVISIDLEENTKLLHGLLYGEDGAASTKE